MSAHLAPPPRRRPRSPLLEDALAREARLPSGRVAVAVRLSALPPPGARPYHRRIARALLDDCAQRHAGQVFALANGDLVLLAPPRAGPVALLNRLIPAEPPLAETIALDRPARLHALLDSAEAAPEDPRPRNIFAGRAAPLLPEAALAELDTAGLADLLGQQTAIRLPDRGAPATAPLRAAHRALAVVPALLAARLAAPGTAPALPADPWLRQHLAARLAAALLATLHRAWGDGTPIDPAPRRGVPPLLLALPPASVAGAGFAALAARLPPPGPRPHMLVAITLAEAAADPDAFAAARARLRAGGMALVLDGVSHHALLLARPDALEPDLIALSWSTGLARLPPPRLAELAAAIARIGPQRLVLTGADTEAALRWGRAAGIRSFRGRHAEAMLAATRIAVCPTPCPLRACAARAAAAAPPGRRGCANPRLLDQGAPDAVQPVP